MARSRRAWTILAGVLILLLPACAGGDVGGGEEEGGGGEALRVAAVWTGAEQENFQAVLDAFTEESGIETSYQSNADLGTFLGTQIEGGDPPDVALLPQPGLMRDLAQQGALQEVGDDAASALEENYAPVWTELGSVDGTLYGVYFKAANKSTWWYNTGVFQQAGVQPPADWDEMLKSAETVNASGSTWISIAGADGWPLTDFFENIYVRTAGPEKYDQLSNHEIPWTDKSVIDALNVFGQLVSEDSNIAGGARGALQTDFPTSVTEVFSDPPEAATVYEGDFVAGVISGETDAKLGTEADFFDFPAVDGSGPAVVGGGDVATALTDNPDAQELLAFLATPEAAEVWAAKGGFTSPNQNVDISVYPDEISQRIAEAVTETETFRFDMSDLQPAEFGATTGRGMFLRFQEFLQNPSDPESVAKNLEKDAKKAFGA